jgi:hypothetical protein
LSLSVELQIYTLPGLLALPPQFHSADALRMLLAIGYQESGFVHRHQMRGGPAHGWWQFEPIGVQGVLEHPASRQHAARVLPALGYRGQPSVLTVHGAIEHCDALASAFARLLLWRLPEPLPGPHERDAAWGQYIEAWGPGKPHPERWPRSWAYACELVAAHDT